MEKKRFPRVSEDFFSSIEEERSYLYKILDFTLQLDEIEDQNMQLTPFLKELLKILKNFLHVDELAIIVKDLHLHSWTPMISYPEVDAIHNSLDFRLLLQTAELASSTQKTIVQVLDKNKGAFLAYPLIFQDRSIGSILLFNYEFGKSTENTNTRSIPTIFNATTPEYSKLLKLLWYINELENDAIVERLEISETQSLLGKYISSQVMEKIIQSPLSIDLEGQENEVTVLFADMCGFTKLSEELPSKVIVTLLNTYWSYLVDIVFKYQGTVDKFIGDCIMVVFNSPIEQKDHYVRACATALDIQKCMDQLRNQSEYKEYQLEISIGINTGSATCGNVGSKDRLEYTVIGDSVNLAARLEQLAVAGEILISESVFEKVHGGFVINRPDQVNLKGKTNLIQPYQLERFFEPKEIIERFSHSSKKEQKNMLASLSFSNELNNAENFID
ncbi:MAG: class 3 adenylate cyclase, partial [bacterium]